MTKPRLAVLKQNPRLLIATLLILISSVSFAQTVTYDTTFGGWNAKVTMRADMNRTTDSVQGIIFIPGTGECGTDISKLLIYGPHYWMTKGWDGSVKLSNGTHYPVIISLQPPAANQRPTTLKTKIDDILKRYRIKRNSVHLTGISQGGWMVNVFASYKPSATDYSYYRLIKSIVNVEGVVPDDTYASTIGYPQRFGNWAKWGGKELWFEQANDGRKMAVGAQNMNDSVPGSATYFKTNFGSGGHSDFDKFYDPAATWTSANAKIMTITGKEVNMNIYQWMLTQGDSKEDPVTPPPTETVNKSPISNAGTNQAITLPTSSVTLKGSGTDEDGSIAGYTWTQVSGPATAVIASATLAQTAVSALITAGKYVFRLTVKDNKNATAYADVTITVNSALPPPTGGGGTGGKGHLIVGPGEYQTFFINEAGKLFGLSSSKSAAGVGSSSGSAVPAMELAVPSNLTFKDVASGLHHSLAVDNNGEVWSWGWNEVGQAGNGTTGSAIYTPVKITQDESGKPFTGVVQVASYYSYNKNSGNVAIKSDGTLWVWGNTAGGMRGDGTDGKVDTRPVQVVIPGNRAIKKVVAAEIVLALATDGTVWSWGGGGFRTQNLGTGNTDFRTPRQVVNLPSDIKDIAGASSYYYAISGTGVPYGWGYYGVYLGIGTSYSGNSPVNTPMNLSSVLNLPKPVASIVCNSVATHAILTDGTLWGWGDNAQGTIGNGEQIDFMKYSTPYAWSFGPGQLMQAKPVQVIPEINNFTRVFGASAYVFYTYALTADGKLYSWGRNKGGVMGNGIVGPSSSIGADYPNAWDVPIATLVNPLGLKKATAQVASYCILNPSAPSCNTQKYVPGSVEAYAGEPQTINLPADSVLLSGNAISPNGQIVSYTWKKTSGPGDYKLSTTSRPTASATGLKAGVYTFELTAKDYEGYTGTSIVTITVNGGTPGNVAPVANAGKGSTITLPVNSVTLDGSASADSDGSIASYKWAKTSGPASFSITNETSAKATVSGLVAGTYTFELTVTDNGGATAKAQVSIVVNPAANNAPVADAGKGTTVTLPVNTVTLDASASADSDGSIASYKWVKTSGPTSFSITNETIATTTVTGLVAGAYTFELTVTDNGGATAKAQVSIVVNPAANKAPVADAGKGTTITLPVNTVTLDASASADSDGSIKSYKWVKTSGPTAFSITNEISATTTVTGLVAGTYTFELTVTDNSGATAKALVSVIVNPAGNVAPVANAGKGSTITLPANSVTLDGSASADSDGSISSYKWTKTAGPASFNITASTSATTTVTGLVAGTYTFELTVTDNSGASAKAQVNIVVNAAANVAPVANAGKGSTITLPANSVTLDGSASADSDGSISSYKWTKTAGPASFNITASTSATTAVTGLVAGTYTFELTVTDNSGASAKAQVNIVVNAAANVAPVANAGKGSTITLPANSVTLDGSASADSDGGISSYKWTKTAGPASFNITASTSATTTVTGLVAGTYTFELTVTDNSGASAKAQVNIVVNAAANVAPVANAGANSTITLPVNSVTLNGSASSDADGSISSYKWTKTAGPASFNITASTSATTTVTGLVVGTYTFELTVTDNSGATAKATVTVAVVPASAGNKPPKAITNSDHTIILPVNYTQLDGSMSADEDGTIAAHQWRLVSGPKTAVIGQTTAAKTSVTGLVEGSYKFELTVTDNAGEKATAVVTVLVQSNNQRYEESVNVYPNPVRSVINLKYVSDNVNEAFVVNVYDISGRVVISKNFTKTSNFFTTTIDASGLRTGIYYLEVKSGKEQKKRVILFKK